MGPRGRSVRKGGDLQREELQGRGGARPSGEGLRRSGMLAPSSEGRRAGLRHLLLVLHDEGLHLFNLLGMTSLSLSLSVVSALRPGQQGFQQLLLCDGPSQAL